ncbi:hypothetical protein G6F59_018573 [Rhizopus arrhizus]|nr:hypothetical protein G6F59_018573 [Rhizopus arrhizus]
MAWRTGPTFCTGARRLAWPKTIALSCWNPSLPMTAMHEISSTLLAMKIAPVRAAMREPGVSIEAAIGIRSHSAKARMNMPMPHLKRHPAGEAAGG